MTSKGPDIAPVFAFHIKLVVRPRILSCGLFLPALACRADAEAVR
jgi:hypothetical protein